MILYRLTMGTDSLLYSFSLGFPMARTMMPSTLRRLKLVMMLASRADSRWASPRITLYPWRSASRTRAVDSDAYSGLDRSENSTPIRLVRWPARFWATWLGS